jgi:hypothetical protein
VLIHSSSGKGRITKQVEATSNIPIAAKRQHTAARARNAVAGPFVALNGPQVAGEKKTRRIPITASNAIRPFRDNIIRTPNNHC